MGFGLRLTPTRSATFILAAILLLIGFKHVSQSPFYHVPIQFIPSSYNWAQHPLKHPIQNQDMVKPPRGHPLELPRIQHDFAASELRKRDIAIHEQRRREIKQAFQKSWISYEESAWGRDELKPVSLGSQDTFGGWAATMIDSLDTLWLMDMKPEFYRAVEYVASLDWNQPSGDGFNVFETNIRHLGGLLSAFELSGEESLLSKAIELGDLLYATMDNPQHLPPHSVSFHDLKKGRSSPGNSQSSVSLGSMTLEFTRLSQLTSNPKYYDAVNRISLEFDRTQNETNLPGLWPVWIDAAKGFVLDSHSFSLGADGDSVYEYLIKEYMLLGGLEPMYGKMYRLAADAAIDNLVFRPNLPDQDDLLMLGSGEAGVRKGEPYRHLTPRVEHLGCFAGGMFAIGGKVFAREDHVEVGEKLARGCAHAYAAYSHGIMPEVVNVKACPTKEACEFSSPQKIPSKANPPGFSARDRGYFLRPEAIESLFVLYRITGKEDLRDIAWDMWTSISKATETEGAFAAVEDVTRENLTQLDSMESFWLAETLKYFWLIFSDERFVSLDEWVFNTEAHPLRRMRNM